MEWPGALTGRDARNLTNYGVEPMSYPPGGATCSQSFGGSPQEGRPIVGTSLLLTEQARTPGCGPSGGEAIVSGAGRDFSERGH